MKDYPSFMKNLKTLIGINSEFSTPKKNMPFGQGVHDALDFFLQTAKSFGFETINYDNYIGEVVFGQGEEIGIIGHLDVVPAGPGWETDPYTLTEKDNVLYGRGVSDDKTPLLSCLYALKELKEEGIIPKRKIRLFTGCDEESSWRDVDYFLTKSTFPEYGFSPDGNFPLSYAEKAIYKVEFIIPCLKNFHDITGGTVINSVCALAHVYADKTVVDATLLNKYGLTVSENGLIESVGVAAHGAHPDQGKNALTALFEYFLACGENVESVLSNLFYDAKGIMKITTEQGNVTLSPNLIREGEGKIFIDCDLRFPYPITIERLTPIFDSFGIEYILTKNKDPLYVPKEGWFVKTLMDAYNQTTGKLCQPDFLCGSTFARAFKFGCAFGPDFLTSDTKIHTAGENLSISDMLTAFNVYKSAIKKLIT